MDINSLNRSHIMSEIIIARPSLGMQGFDLKQHLEVIEIELINDALVKSKGIVASAARLLGIRRTTLIEKMKKYQIVKNKLINE
jgi:DNA-binding NtrC family response regulator